MLTAQPEPIPTYQLRREMPGENLEGEGNLGKGNTSLERFMSLSPLMTVLSSLSSGLALF